MKKIFGIMLALLLIGTVIGAVVLNNRTLSLDKILLDEAKLKSLDTYNIEDYQRGELYQRCLKKEDCSYEIIYDNEVGENINVSDCKSIINTCSGFMPQSNLSKWEEERIKKILEVSLDRKASDRNKVSGGVTTINEKK